MDSPSSIDSSKSSSNSQSGGEFDTRSGFIDTVFIDFTSFVVLWNCFHVQPRYISYRMI